MRWLVRQRWAYLVCVCLLIGGYMGLRFFVEQHADRATVSVAEVNNTTGTPTIVYTHTFRGAAAAEAQIAVNSTQGVPAAPFECSPGGNDPAYQYQFAFYAYGFLVETASATTQDCALWSTTDLGLGTGHRREALGVTAHPVYDTLYRLSGDTLPVPPRWVNMPL